jgi:GNAT superfamily N-acetyltransferase
MDRHGEIAGSAPRIRPFQASDANWVSRMHGALYAREAGFDDTFETLVRRILDDFITRNDTAHEMGWIAERQGERLGCIFCMREDDTTARLRLFLLIPAAQGLGLGRRMVETCMGFARDRGYRGMCLTTHESHRAACALYRKTGWQMVSSRPTRSYGQPLVEQSWQITF